MEEQTGDVRLMGDQVQPIHIYVGTCRSKHVWKLHPLSEDRLESGGVWSYQMTQAEREFVDKVFVQDTLEFGCGASPERGAWQHLSLRAGRRRAWLCWAGDCRQKL